MCRPARFADHCLRLNCITATGKGIQTTDAASVHQIEPMRHQATTYGGGLSGQPLLQSFELVTNAGRQLLADEVEPLFDERDLGLPLVDVDREGSVMSASDTSRPSMSSADPVGTTPIGVSMPAALCSMRSTIHFRTREFSPKPGHRKRPVVAAAEPVDVEDLGELGRVRGLAEVDPVLEVVTDVVAEGTAALPSDRGEPYRPGLRLLRSARSRPLHP